MSYRGSGLMPFRTKQAHFLYNIASSAVLQAIANTGSDKLYKVLYGQLGDAFTCSGPNGYCMFVAASSYGAVACCPSDADEDWFPIWICRLRPILLALRPGFRRRLFHPHWRHSQRRCRGNFRHRTSRPGILVPNEEEQEFEEYLAPAPNAPRLPIWWPRFRLQPKNTLNSSSLASNSVPPLLSNKSKHRRVVSGKTSLRRPISTIPSFQPDQQQSLYQTLTPDVLYTVHDAGGDVAGRGRIRIIRTSFMSWDKTGTRRSKGEWFVVPSENAWGR
ncbi:uncharacterized protein BCR38DRAFT_409792 [Pseudomassariella vexata]|uniref:Uncharacterized protein n=1 Tax=Pseudomassariella vexata TaxID=1141098 RepID=A0A1Y2DZ93_9PEZI|nr:uncharacterized protein BCR38DRAFT_409792 [Pseudomassariella vexata]ORY64426.1 hypothetical protein BCR38DRAFT_409792 [Pseudomassariella vexata]